MVLGTTRYTDGADVLHNKWTVLLMLLLSLVAFIVPLHPTFNNNGDGPSQPTAYNNDFQQPSRKSGPSSVQIQCWCPNEFTSNYVNYATAFCKSSYIKALSGIDTGAIYLPTDDPIPLDPEDRKSLAIAELIKSRDDDRRTRRLQKLSLVDKDVRNRVQKLVTYQIPLMFVLLALLLMVPRLVWAGLHDCFGVSKPEEIVETVKEMELKNLSEGRSHQTKSPVLSQILRSASKSQSLLLVVKKVLSILIAAILLAFVAQHVVPKVDKLTTDQSTAVKQLNDFHQNMDGTQDDKSHTDTVADVTNNTDTKKNGIDGDGLIFLCAFSIRNLQNTQSWTVQCLASEGVNQVESTPSPSTPSPVDRYSNKDDATVLEFESTMLGVAMALLTVLLVSNVLNTTGWLYRLTSRGYRKSLGLSPNVSMDTLLIAHLVRSRGGMSTFTLDEEEKQNLNELQLNE